MSPISSRKSVPPSACSKRPRLVACAPVKAPRTWPNSSLSSRPSGIAAQLIGTKGFSRAAAVDVDRARDELLAGAALAGDQHARVDVRRAADQREHVAHRRAVADQVAEARCGRRRGAARGSPPRARAARARARRCGAPPRARTAGHVVEGARAHRLDRGVDAAERGHQDDRRRRAAARAARRPARCRTSRACGCRRARRRSRARRAQRRAPRPPTRPRAAKPCSSSSESSISRIARSSSTSRSWVRTVPSRDCSKHATCQRPGREKRSTEPALRATMLKTGDRRLDYLVLALVGLVRCHAGNGDP